MKLVYVTHYDNREYRLDNWSGISYFMARAFRQAGVEVAYIGPLQKRYAWLYNLKQYYYNRFQKRRYLKDRDILLYQDYARQIQDALKRMPDADVVFTQGCIPAALVHCKQPIVSWSEATFAGAIDFYPEYQNLCTETLRDGHLLEQGILARCGLALFASHWAAQSALDHYRVDPAKVHVVPFGANLFAEPSPDEVHQMIEQRPSTVCRLLFVGGDWRRKGWPVVYETARQLNAAGLQTTLDVVGSHPPVEEPLPPFLTVHGRLDKTNPAEAQQLARLYGRSHFLMMPSRAEMFGVVFCEASAYGVPSVASDVGGIPTAVRNGVNGQVFPADTPVSVYCEYLANQFQNYPQYLALARSAYREYQTCLNWRVAAQTARQLIENVLQVK